MIYYERGLCGSVYKSDWALSDVRTMMVEMDSVSQILVCLKHRTWLSAWDDFTEFCCHKSIKIYIYTNMMTMKMT